MAVIAATDEDVQILARLIRAEAEGEGKQGMLNAGNVMVNRVRYDCSDFTDIRTIPQMAFQSPGGFEAVQKGYFYQRARDQEIELARRLIRGEQIHPGERALWFFRPDAPCPGEWFGQPLAGQFKAHCFYNPTYNECPRVW
ncbi:cell wall hydrolase [Geomicrobium sediminis]|uniref:N-acetylmuramoyl-L-alanine amidase n=1 Tax=Geomicrobium sediminis TaxID=1347788 RepID=A0ABS2PGB7_9BACL|nr:cell wall hydrolase [Geomicrobium sediminis]MBM7634473.1 N-acetylmuramoyl-L-alanine amidase [Geomicrobium sediminis]